MEFFNSIGSSRTSECFHQVAGKQPEAATGAFDQQFNGGDIER